MSDGSTNELGFSRPIDVPERFVIALFAFSLVMAAIGFFAGDNSVMIIGLTGLLFFGISGGGWMLVRRL